MVLFLLNFGITLHKKKKRIIPVSDQTLSRIISSAFYAILFLCIYFYLLKKYALDLDSSTTDSGNIMRTIKKLRLKEYFKVLFVHVVVSGAFVLCFGLKPHKSTINRFKTHKIMVLSNIVTMLILYKYVFKWHNNRHFVSIHKNSVQLLPNHIVKDEWK